MVEDDLAGRGRSVEIGWHEDAATHEADPAQVWRQAPLETCREVVQDGDLIASLQEPPDQVMPDETGSPGDQDPHDRPRGCLAAVSSQRAASRGAPEPRASGPDSGLTASAREAGQVGGGSDWPALARRHQAGIA